MNPPTIAETLFSLGYTYAKTNIEGRNAVYNKHGQHIGNFTADDAVNYLEATYGPQVLQAKPPALHDNQPREEGR